MRIARDLSDWPRLRAAVLTGRVTWSAVGVVLRRLRSLAEAKAALTDEALTAAEQTWLEHAECWTVRELRAAVREADSDLAVAARLLFPTGVFLTRGAVHPFLQRLPTHVLTLTVTVESAWWFHCARSVYERAVSDCPGSARSTENFLFALLAEARTELKGCTSLDEAALERWGSYVRMLDEWREESERRCDAQRPRLAEGDADAETMEDKPHHLKFRSQGGGDEEDNLTSLCTWCHLEGVHGGRLKVTPPASTMHWRIGAVSTFEVQGRQKTAQ